MMMVLVAWLGGVLSILSLCILPLLLFVLARADRPFMHNGLPLLLGMAGGFVFVTRLAAVAAPWAAQALHGGRAVALAVLILCALSLLASGLSGRWRRSGTTPDARPPETASRASSIAVSLLLGAAAGVLWTPCAGPVLGLLASDAAWRGGLSTVGLLLAYALGAATSLAAVLWWGGRLLSTLMDWVGPSAWIRRALGMAVLAGVAVSMLGGSDDWLSRWSAAHTRRIESALLAAFPMTPSARAASLDPAAPLPIEGMAPPLDGAVAWLNSKPLEGSALRGKVVLVDFWTYSCINCLRALPWVRAWAERYRDQGLVVVGVHAPEFDFEKDLANVRRAVAELGITYPVAVDNDYAIWRAFGNRYWPAHYFIDAQGRLRHHHYGEGDYVESERVIRKLLAEAGNPVADAPYVVVNGQGAQAAPDLAQIASPETYVGSLRAERFASPGGQRQGRSHEYTVPASLGLNQWGLGGRWSVRQEKAVLDAPGGNLTYRFHARDLNLVLGPGRDAKPIRFIVRIDGQAPAASHGSDIDAQGHGRITTQRLYQLIRSAGEVRDRTFEIEFLDAGAEAFAFTFG